MTPSIHFFYFAKWNFLSNYLEDKEVDLVFKKSKLQTIKQWLFCGYLEKQPFRGALRKRCSENMQQIYRRTPIPKCDFNKVTLQLYWNYISAWVFCCKFTAYFQNTLSWKHLQVPASVSKHYKSYQNLYLIQIPILVKD